MSNLTGLVVVAMILFSLGAAVLVIRKNVIVCFMGVELMLNAINLLFVVFSKMHGSLEGQIMVFFVMAIAAAEAAIGLAIIISLFRAQTSVSVSDASTLGG